MMTLSLLFTIVLPIQAEPADRPRSGIPEDWPQPPTFRKWIDYYGWFESRLPQDPPCDAGPKWRAIWFKEDDPTERKQEVRARWGMNDEEEIPGLLTGGGNIPAHRAWDPADHPEWDKAYLTQRATGLLRDLHEIAECPFLLSPTDPIYMGIRGPANQEMADYVGRPLLFGSSHFGGGPQRSGVKVVIQNAWRAPGGKVDSRVITQSIMDTLRYAQQLDYSGAQFIDVMIGMAIRPLAYDTMARAIDQDILALEDLMALERWMEVNSRPCASWQDIQAIMLAEMYENLQLLYWPGRDEEWPREPQPNPVIIKSHQDAWDELRKLGVQYGADTNDRINLAKEIAEGPDPRQAVRNLTGMFLRTLQIVENELPQDAAERIEKLLEDAAQDPDTHVMLRRTMPTYLGSTVGLLARAEAERRGMRLLVTLHRIKLNSGRWPESLKTLEDVVPAEALIDPFSRKPFIYRVNGENMTLYSVGYDGRDNGGKHDSRWGLQHEGDKDKVIAADYVFWPFQREKP